MHAMVLNSIRSPLQWTEFPDRQPGANELRTSASPPAASAELICTWVDGELSDAELPIIPGHEIVGRIDAIGPGVEDLGIGERVGIPWLGHTCGVCPYCRMRRENLCDHPVFTGYTRDGGFATSTIAERASRFPSARTGTTCRWPPCCAPA